MNISMNKTIGNRIRECRISQHLTQNQLAEITGFSTSYISRIECGSSRPTLETLCLIADSLNVNIGVILCDLLAESSGDPIVQEITSYAANLPLYAQEHLLSYVKMLPQLVEKSKSSDKQNE